MASLASQSASVSSGRAVPVASIPAPPTRHCVASTLNPSSSAHRWRTSIASAITSGPIPSPAKTAIFNVCDIIRLECARRNITHSAHCENEVLHFLSVLQSFTVFHPACNIDGVRTRFEDCTGDISWGQSPRNDQRFINFRASEKRPIELRTGAPELSFSNSVSQDSKYRIGANELQQCNRS